MFEEANAELEEIDPFCRRLPEVLAVRLHIYEAARRWDAAATVAKQLMRDDPADPRWPISLAYATRRLDLIQSATSILHAAVAQHSDEAIIHYN